LPREDVRDPLVSAFADSIEDLPPGATFGAASLRRQAQALRLRPDLRPELSQRQCRDAAQKAEAGEFGANLLALAGLKRLGLIRRARAVLDLENFLPAPGQGAIAITARSGDTRALGALEPISHAETSAALAAERT
jgi:hydroxymethylbilane synthase